MNLKEKIKNLFRKPFVVKAVGSYATFDIENGNKVILYRTTIKHHTPSVAGLVTIGTGVALDLKPGYCGILEPRRNIGASGLVMANAPRIIMPGDVSELDFDFYLSQNPHFSEQRNYYEPYALGQMIGYVTIVKTV